MGSSRKDSVKILVSVRSPQAEKFLQWLANLGDDSDAASDFLSKNPDMFHSSATAQQVLAYSRELRRAWDSPDRRTRDWYIFSLRRAHALVNRSLAAKENSLYPLEEMLQTPLAQLKDKDWDWLTAPPPRLTLFEAILYYFQARVGDLAKHCAHVDCPAPYFIAEKRSQKFCSEECAGPANREAKRKWWSENRGKAVSK